MCGQSAASTVGLLLAGGLFFMIFAKKNFYLKNSWLVWLVWLSVLKVLDFINFFLRAHPRLLEGVRLALFGLVGLDCV